ncbi:ABC transporter substrate-binding protein [Bacillus cereus]|nr:ABC transporter substrate-binding protein [Bacillus cereus]
MTDIDYYTLRAYLYPREVNQKVFFTLTEIEKVLKYSKQNVKKKLKRYHELGYLEYLPGRGRGNQSCLIFKESFYSEVNKVLKQELANKNINFSLSIVQLNIPRSWFFSFRKELNEIFEMHGTDNNSDTIRLLLNRKLATLNPLVASLSFESFLIQNLSETLLKYNVTDKKVEPCIAHHWEHNKDFTKWTFDIRKHIYFHHGRELDSLDVKHTFFNAQKGLTSKWLVSNIKDIICDTPYRITFSLSYPDPFFEKIVSHYPLVILPRDVLFNEDSWIGCGKFILEEKKEDYLLLKAFPNYFKELPLTDKIEFWYIKKDIHYPMLYSPSKESHKEEIVKITKERCGVNYLIFSQKTQNYVVNNYMRKALCQILDIGKMGKDLKKDHITPISSFFFRISGFDQKEENILDLIEKSNYKGQTLILGLIDHPRVIEDGKWFVNEAQKFGIKLILRPYKFDSDFYKTELEFKTHMSFGSEIPTSDIEIGFLDFILNDTLLLNRFLSKKHLLEINQMAQNYRMKTNSGSRKIISLEIENYLLSNNLLKYTYRPCKHFNVQSLIQGFEVDENGNVDLGKIWI